MYHDNAREFAGGPGRAGEVTPNFSVTPGRGIINKFGPDMRVFNVDLVGREVKLNLLAGVGKPGASGDNRRMSRVMGYLKVTGCHCWDCHGDEIDPSFSPLVG